jgi:hypothetical protein
MRQLSFEGFLKKYVIELSYCKSNSLRKLSDEALKRNSQLHEPLLLFAYFTHGSDAICKLFQNNDKLMYDYNRYFLQHKNSCEILQILNDDGSPLPDSYKDVYKAYLSARNRHDNDNYTKLLMKNSIIRLQKEKCVTDYRLYTSLHVNPGNFNAFMKHGRLDKLSLCIISNMLSHLESCPDNLTQDRTYEACNA